MQNIKAIPLLKQLRPVAERNGLRLNRWNEIKEAYRIFSKNNPAINDQPNPQPINAPICGPVSNQNNNHL